MGGSAIEVERGRRAAGGQRYDARFEAIWRRKRLG